MRLNTPSSETTPPDPAGHFLATVNDLFDHALQNVNDSDLVGIAVYTQDNQNDRPIGISFKRKYVEKRI